MYTKIKLKLFSNKIKKARIDHRKIDDIVEIKILSKLDHENIMKVLINIQFLKLLFFYQFFID